MIELHRALIERKIEALNSGQQCGLKEMFGVDWDTIGSPGERKDFGRLFKQAVQNGSIKGVSWVRIENSGRFDVYEKL